MSISFQCAQCGKKYTVPDSYAGKSAKCKSCQAVMSIPRQEQEPELQLDDLASLGGESQTSSGDYGPSLEANRPAFRARTASQSVQPAGNRDGKVPAWFSNLTGIFEHITPRRFWTWFLLALAGVVLIGSATRGLAQIAMMMLLPVGGFALAVGLVWAILVGIWHGAKVMIGAIVAAPLIAIAAIGRGMRNYDRSHPNGSDLSPWAMGFSIAGGIAVIAVIIGAFKNPRAFKSCGRLIAAGVLAMICALAPKTIRAMVFGDTMSSRTETFAAPGYTPPPVYRPPSMPVRPGNADGTSSTERPVTSRPPRPRPRIDTPATKRSADSTETPSSITKSSSPSPAGSPGDLLKVGNDVEAKWGGSWWGAKINRIENGWYEVTYSDNTKEWIAPWRIRATGSKVDNVPYARPIPYKPEPPATPPPPAP